jgi:5-methylcytosine-specific restriction protein A
LEQPLCVLCLGRERYVQATVVDHVLPIKDGGERFESCNLQSLCVSCHNRKTAHESAQRRRTGGGSFF